MCPKVRCFKSNGIGFCFLLLKNNRSFIISYITHVICKPNYNYCCDAIKLPEKTLIWGGLCHFSMQLCSLSRMVRWHPGVYLTSTFTSYLWKCHWILLLCKSRKDCFPCGCGNYLRGETVLIWKKEWCRNMFSSLEYANILIVKYYHNGYAYGNWGFPGTQI